MSEPSTIGFRHYRQLALVGSLVFATLVCLGMFTLRVAHSHLFTYRYLSWNLFFAWLPIFSALVAYNLQRGHSWANWVLLPASALVWLVFFPNSPCVILLLMHLQPLPSAPFGDAVILLFTMPLTL